MIDKLSIFIQQLYDTFTIPSVATICVRCHLQITHFMDIRFNCHASLYQRYCILMISHSHLQHSNNSETIELTFNYRNSLF